MSIKTSSGLTSGNNLPGGKINSCIADLYYLGLVDAGVRRLVLTNPAFYDIFMTRMRGAIAHGIEVVLSPLDAELQAEVDQVIAAASKEIGATATEAIAVAAEDDAENVEIRHFGARSARRWISKTISRRITSKVSLPDHRWLCASGTMTAWS